MKKSWMIALTISITLFLQGCAKQDPLMEQRGEIFAAHREMSWFQKRFEAIDDDDPEKLKEVLDEGGSLNGLYADLSWIEESRLDVKYDHERRKQNPVKTALQKAVLYGSKKIIRYLLEDLKVDPNEVMTEDLSPILKADRETPLSHACKEILSHAKKEYRQSLSIDMKEIVEMLLKHGAKIDESAATNAVESFVENKCSKLGADPKNMPYSILKGHKGFDEKAKKAALDEWLSSRMIYLNLAWGKKEWIAFADSHIKELSNEKE